jgi:hypothetical protein
VRCFSEEKKLFFYSKPLERRRRRISFEGLLALAYFFHITNNITSPKQQL